MSWWLCRGSRSDSFPKGAVLVIIWLMLIRFCDPSVIVPVKFSAPLAVLIIMPFLLLILYVLLPIIGLYADIKWGRFHVAVGCLTISILVSGLYIMDALLNTKSQNNPTVALISYMMTPIFIVAHRCFTVILLSFGTDLLIEGSSRQLSSFIWWHFWCLYFGWFVSVTSACVLNSEAQSKSSLFLQTIHFVCLVVILISCITLKTWFVSEPNSSTNPLVLIANVLNYARKTGHSSLYQMPLTNYQAATLSRMDLAKSVNGGPFTADEVDNVKIFFRLLPLLVCIQMIHIPTQPIGRAHTVALTIPQCLVTSSYAIIYVIAIIGIPIKQVLLQCINSPRVRLLQRIGFGIALSLISKIAFTGVDVMVIFKHNTTCPLTSSGPNNTVEANNYITDSNYFIIPEIIGGVGVLFIIPTSLEFFYAQSPYIMRTLFVGLFVAVGGIFEIVGWESLRIFRIPVIADARPGCEFYVFLMNCLVTVFIFVLFLCLCKCYKLRERSNTLASSMSSYLFPGSYSERYGSLSVSSD